MSEAAVQASSTEPVPLRAALAALRGQGAERLDPLRFRFLEALAERTAAASGPVQALIEARCQTALDDYTERFRQAQSAAAEAVAQLSASRPAVAREGRRLLQAGDFSAVHKLVARVGSPSGPRSHPLAELNRHIRLVSEPVEAGGDAALPELKSVRRFREMWSRMAAVDDVDAAVGRGPENAGPLNSHMLVLRSLGLMRQVSPAYLRRFLAQVEALLWLEEESQRVAPVEVKPPRRGRGKG